jgi:hypothetical protein
MKSKLRADARHKYEQARASAYRDFYRELEAVGKLSVARAISHKAFSEAVTEIGKAPSGSSPPSSSPFERALFGLYAKIMIGYKQYLLDAHLPTSTVVRRLANQAELAYHEIYQARIEEFAQRGGFYAEKTFPKFYLQLLPVNARGQTSDLFRQLEDEVLALEESNSDRAVEIIDSDGSGRNQSDVQHLDRHRDEETHRVPSKGASKLRGRRCDPRLWKYFSYEKTSKTSKYRELLIYDFVSLAVPANRTDRDVVEQIAENSRIPIESLSDSLNRQIYPRGQAIFGFVGDEFDQVAHNYDNMQWWLSDAGLNMAIVSPVNRGAHIPNFDQLVSGQILAERAETQRPLQPRKINPTVQKIKRQVRQLRKEGLDYKRICDKLASTDRPPRATWRDDPWPLAYKKHPSAVTKWLSEACTDLRSQARRG